MYKRFPSQINNTPSLLSKNQATIYSSQLSMRRDEYVVQRNTENCNEEAGNWQLRPSRESYIVNSRHKAHSKKAYFLYLMLQEYNEKNDTMSRFNFKKTNGRKKKYSCGGYGGRCSMCSVVYGDGKYHRKIEINSRDHFINKIMVKSSLTIY